MHVQASSHVAESSLAGTVGTSSSNTRDTRHGPTSTPGDGRVLHTRLHVHTIRLPLVLADVGVDTVNNILADRSKKDVWHRQRRHSLVAVSRGEDADDWSRRAHRRTRLLANSDGEFGKPFLSANILLHPESEFKLEKKWRKQKTSRKQSQNSPLQYMM